MRFTRFNKTIVLFIAISIGIHLCLLGILRLEGSSGFPSNNPFRIKVALNNTSNQKSGTQEVGNKLNPERSAEITPNKESTSSNPGSTKNIEPPIKQSNGWGATKGPIYSYSDAISERSAMQSRMNSERQQRLNSISGNVAQLLGRLNQEGITVGCGLWINQSANKGFLKCNPENFTEQMKFYLAPANIEWVNPSDLQPPAMCIPIQIRDAHAGC